MKRFLDIVCAALGLIVLLPLLCPLAILLRMTGEGKVFYRQERMGFGSKPFFILKFATMLENSPSLGSGDITLKNDPRVLPVGRVLRKTKINELPQLWNVLNGEMSLVGPRPPLRKYVDRHKSLYASVLKSKPGITGLATLYFHRHENYLLSRSRSAAETDEIYSRRCVPMKAKLDIIYSQRGSICFDRLILIKTAIKLISR